MAGSHKGKKWFVRFGRPGMADILAVADQGNSAQAELNVFWIEVKGPDGSQSWQQAAFQAEVEREGMTYLLARSLEDVIAVLK